MRVILLAGLALESFLWKEFRLRESIPAVDVLVLLNTLVQQQMLDCLRLVGRYELFLGGWQELDDVDELQLHTRQTDASRRVILQCKHPVHPDDGCIMRWESTPLAVGLDTALYSKQPGRRLVLPEMCRDRYGFQTMVLGYAVRKNIHVSQSM